MARRKPPPSHGTRSPENLPLLPIPTTADYNVCWVCNGPIIPDEKRVWSFSPHRCHWMCLGCIVCRAPINMPRLPDDSDDVDGINDVQLERVPLCDWCEGDITLERVDSLIEEGVWPEDKIQRDPDAMEEETERLERRRTLRKSRRESLKRTMSARGEGSGSCRIGTRREEMLPEWLARGTRSAGRTSSLATIILLTTNAHLSPEYAPVSASSPLASPDPTAFSTTERRRPLPHWMKLLPGKRGRSVGLGVRVGRSVVAAEVRRLERPAHGTTGKRQARAPAVPTSPPSAAVAPPGSPSAPGMSLPSRQPRIIHRRVSRPLMSSSPDVLSSGGPPPYDDSSKSGTAASDGP